MTTDYVPEVSREEIRACTPMILPDEALEQAGYNAIRANPANAVDPSSLSRIRTSFHATSDLDSDGDIYQPARIAVLANRYWPPGTTITVAFLGGTKALHARVIFLMIEWSKYTSIKFRLAKRGERALCRIGFDPRQGSWSYVGLDNAEIPYEQLTMNLGWMSLQTPETEARRVVWHEVAHLLGCPHEHQRKEIVDLLDPAACTWYFGGPPNNWPPRTVQQQVLTPIPAASLWGGPVQITSITCYGFPAQLTRSRQPIPGGSVITPEDAEFMGRVYGKSTRTIKSAIC
jgi:hypothetical protein